MYAINKALTKLAKKWDNYIPIFALREELPHTPRNILDVELFKLESEDRLEFSALAEPVHYSAEEISAGIDVGSEQCPRLLFFLIVHEVLTNEVKPIETGPELTPEKLEVYEILADELKEMEALKDQLEARIEAKKREIEEHMRVDETHIRSTPETRPGHDWDATKTDPFPIKVDIATVTTQMRLAGFTYTLNRYDEHIKPIWAALWSRPQTVKELSGTLGISANVIRRRLKILGEGLTITGKTGNSKIWGVKEEIKNVWRFRSNNPETEEKVQ